MSSEVKRYALIDGKMHAEPVGKEHDFATRYVCAGIYAALEAECERLRQSMTGMFVRHFAKQLDRVRRDAELEQYLSDGIAQLEAERDCLKSERDYLSRQLDRLIDQTTPLQPDATNPRWAERIKLDDVIAERDSLAAELAAIKSETEK